MTDRLNPSALASLDEYDLLGRLGVFTLSDLLQMLSFLQKTGTLSLIQGWNTRTITFEHGNITYVAAGSRLPSIPDLLIRTGKVELAHLEELRRRGIRTEDAIIRHLKITRAITEADLQACQEQLLEISIYTLFLWRNCRFTFTSSQRVSEGGVPVSVDSMHLIIEGTRRVDEWIEISPVVPSVYVIFRRRSPMPVEPVPEEFLPVFRLVDGLRDVAAIALEAGITQFQAARALYHLTRAGFVEAVPPNREKIIELFTLAVESIYLKLILFDHARIALEFENQLNRFALQHGLRVRMAAGRVIKSDRDTPLSATELIDLYKLFIAIQNNKFSKMFEPVVAQGLMEGLYRHADPELQQMLRMYEFYEIEGLLLLDMFREPRAQRTRGVQR
jgi:hypothetical protein